MWNPRPTSNPLDQLIISQGGPNGEEIIPETIRPPRQIDIWNPLRMNDDGEIEINEIEYIPPHIRDIPDYVNTRIKVWELITEPVDLVKVDIEQFVNQEAARKYECPYCLSISNFNYVHNFRDCQVFMCLQCYNQMRKQRTTDRCVRRCGSVNFIPEMIPLNKYRDWSINKLRDLKLKCERNCGETVLFKVYFEHSEKFCRRHRNYCKKCLRVFKAPHNCEVIALKKQLEDANKTIDRLRCELEAARINNTKIEGIPSTWSNSSKGKREWVRDGKVRLVIHYQGREFKISDLSIDESNGIDLRRKIERTIGNRVGDIVKFEHHTIKAEKTLRQNTFSHRPTHVQVLPYTENFKLQEGQLLGINVLRPGTII